MKNELKPGDLFLNRGAICKWIGRIRHKPRADWFEYLTEASFVLVGELMHTPVEIKPLGVNLYESAEKLKVYLEENT